MMPSSDLIIDNETYKIMKFLYGKTEVPYSKLEQKFGEETALLVRPLCTYGYAAMRRPDGTLTQDTSIFSSQCKFGLLVPGNKRVEEIRESKVIRYTPLFLSAVSVIVSIVALLVANNGVYIIIS